MDISFNCSACKSALVVAEKHAGLLYICKACGVPIIVPTRTPEAEQKQPPSVPTPFPSKSPDSFCPKCGAKRPAPDACFCMKCGFALNNPEPVNQNQKLQSPIGQSPDSASICPYCQSRLSQYAVICSNCKMDLRTGKPITPRNIPTSYNQASQFQTTSDAAVWSLVLGILSMLGLFCVAGIPAILCGHSARSSIENSRGKLKGEGMALAGLIMGYLSFVPTVIISFLLFGATSTFNSIADESRKSTCQNGQRLVRDGVEQWAMANNIAEGDATVAADVLSYIKGGGVPRCPEGNVIIAIPALVGQAPVCPVKSVTEAHTLPY